jgi:hypothetical protein
LSAPRQVRNPRRKSVASIRRIVISGGACDIVRRVSCLSRGRVKQQTLLGNYSTSCRIIGRCGSAVPTGPNLKVAANPFFRDTELRRMRLEWESVAREGCCCRTATRLVARAQMSMIFLRCRHRLSRITKGRFLGRPASRMWYCRYLSFAR